MQTALYVHFPFCVRKCLYCDFNSVAGSSFPPSEYVTRVVTEMALRRPRLEGEVTSPTLYLGGGTPSLMPPKDAARLIDAAARFFGLSADAEITLEANPGTVTAESLAGYRAAGVNRLSLGVQSFNDRFLRQLGRVHAAADAVAAVAAARKAGFGNIGLDLIHSLPGENLRLWEEDLEQAVRLAPEHLSAYGLTVEEGTPFHRLEEEGKLPLPTEDESAEMLLRTREFLAAAGYEHYEIANFARPGFRSRHNQTYWRRDDYLGFGAGAHSFLRSPRFGLRWHNAPSPEEYLAAIDAGTLPETERDEVTERQARGEFLFLGFRLLDGVDGERFREEFGLSVEEAFPEETARLADRGLLERRGGRWRLTPGGVPVANQVFMCFV